MIDCVIATCNNVRSRTLLTGGAAFDQSASAGAMALKELQVAA